VPEKEMYSLTKGQLMAQLDVSFGGRIAEELSNLYFEYRESLLINHLFFPTCFCRILFKKLLVFGKFTLYLAS
jgi:hypothetical protein